ncbi:ABC transporter ATP-binding protein [Anaerofustis sp.]|uniref:ABC transporter ATP-binding protein n=1 Tax=Anaerofustis sp. TaxID=1872517 RepID=UPI0025BE5B61|nr:ABC transporter ATP-binding protein [Anaerofustis sp.]
MAKNNDIMIKLEHINKKFGEKEALKDVTFSVKKGEILGFLGPSGAGKTTLIKILTGQITSDLGIAEVFGKEAIKLQNEDYEKLGMVLDDSGVYERLTCFDNILFFADIHGISRQEVHDVFDKVDLADAKWEKAGNLSKGMRQRLVIARAILHKPELIFLDEPTSGLDPLTSQKIHNLLFELKEQGTTIFLTTHNMEEATRLCDHVALLNEGVIVEYGVPEELCRKYNDKNEVTILLKSNEKVTYLNNNENANKIYEHFKNNEVVSIHSSEPTLETVFISLTGRKLI